ncbi:hypothetical protein GCM10010228_70470 [Streptomyces massasporeus]|nr:hypothetical protein GCM10010228_70470 [Streptomyces massasporeus]
MILLRDGGLAASPQVRYKLGEARRELLAFALSGAPDQSARRGPLDRAAGTERFSDAAAVTLPVTLTLYRGVTDVVGDDDISG